MLVDLWYFKSYVYDAVRALPFIRTILERETERLAGFVRDVSPSVSWVLDVGTGTGSTADVFSPDFRVVGLDRSFPMVRRAWTKRRVVGVVGEACRLPLKNGVVPFLTAVGLVEYLRDAEFFLDEVIRVLDSRGYFLVTIAPPSAWNFLRNLLGNRIYSVRSDGWEKLVKERGFAIVGAEKTLLQGQYLLRAPR